ncbi:MAG: hypothetical protein WCX64_02100 [Candidatus Micrarchaeia archaeon]
MIIEVKDKDLLVARIIRQQDWEPGLKFYSDPTDFLQAATWNYERGKHLKAHGHNICERTSNRTHEVLFVKRGKVKATFFGEDDALLKEIELTAGDIAVIQNGGHSYDVLEDGTQVLEIKNGPYPGIEKDKKVIEQ